MTLKDLKIGKSAVIKKVGGEGSLRQHFLDMGVIPGARAVVVKYAPMGDPMELRIHGYELTLRLADAEKIEIDESTIREASENQEAENCISGLYSMAGSCRQCRENCRSAGEGKRAKGKRSERRGEHPGLGEEGRYHVETDAAPLAGGKQITFALAGNQNCGKTTLFNQLTGANQHVGNFPGVTVDQKSGSIKGYPETKVTDLPGIYSLSPYSSEEIVSREFILGEKPDGIINIVDATNIERNLYLTMQLMELDTPVVLALNMMDEVRGNGGTIDINEMEAMLGIPVVPISASKNEGIDELVAHAVHIARNREKPGRTDFCRKDQHGGAVHRCLHGIMHLIEDHAAAAGVPLRFAASKLAEGDERVLKALNLSENEKEIIEHIISQMEAERGLDRSAAIADMRFDFIQRLCAATVVRPKESREHERSRRADKFLTGKYTAIPAFVCIMALIFWLTFNVIGAWLQGLLESGIDWLTIEVDAWLIYFNVNPALHSLIIDGIFNGVGSVLSFIPIIVTLFFFLSLLEDSGYMARIAFVMDKLLRKIGLSGRSIVPMLIGFGCTVPGVMAARTLPSARDRRMTIMLTPFMSCTAKLPIYGFFTAAFFPGKGALIMVALYFTGIIVGILAALVSKGFMFRGEAVPFVMELPNYRMPGAKNVARLLWDKAGDFLQRAFTIIFIASIVVWFLQTFDFRLNIVDDSHGSMLAVIAGFIAPLFAPLGFGDWRISTALIAGFMAKESVVSTLSVLLKDAEAITSILTPLSAISLLVFCLLYTPCVAAVASIKRELGGRWAMFVVIGQCLIAWICAFIVRMIGMAIGFA
ncbi:MAG: ferrous iron transport protein B [Anaerovoracaceae bacterium]